MKNAQMLINALTDDPELLSLTLDADGFSNVLEVLKGLNITYTQLEDIIKSDDKCRFELKENMIRVTPGHSIEIDEESFKEFNSEHYAYTGVVYHGISLENLESILENGISKMDRQFVQCSLDISTARIVANKHKDNTVILKIDINRSYSKWLISENNVILTKHVSPNAIVDIIYKNQENEKDTTHSKMFTNKSLTPDGNIIQSTHRHDYVVHNDKNGEVYVVDGGINYRRCSINVEEAIDISIYEGAIHEVIRQNVKWGTYGINGDQPLSHVKVADMNIEHIYAILKTQNISNMLFKILTYELNYRRN